MAERLHALESSLPPELWRLLRKIGEKACERGESAYVVGGIVRDLLLGKPNFDLDVVIEGEAISLARQIGKAEKWEVRTHPHFGTAKLQAQDFSLDLATARSESYAQPGALPTVKPSTIYDDLFRRDFTINAMAASLKPDSFGELLDPFGGQSDLKKGLIRILHSESFSDDPTRILRALRYEQRFNFQLEDSTKALLCRDRDILNMISRERLWHELELILNEEKPEKVFCRAQELGVLYRFCPPVKANGWLVERFIQARKFSDKDLFMPKAYLSLMVYRLSEQESKNFIEQLKMPGWAKRIVRETVQLKRALPSLSGKELPPSLIYRELKHYSPEVIMALSLASDSSLACKWLQYFLNTLRHITISLNGEKLKEMGIEPGRKMGEILRAVHEARLDGKISSGEEEELARKLYEEK